MKAIKRIIISLVVIVAILGVAVIGGYIYVRSAYGIDLFRTAGQLKTLTEQVNEAELCPNAYADSDFVDLKNSVNAEIEGLVKFEEGKGYNGYILDFNALIGANLSKTIALSEKQVGALAQTVFFEQTGGKIQLGGKQTDVTIVQTDFSEIAENGSIFRKLPKTAVRISTSSANSTFRRSKRIWTNFRTVFSKSIFPTVCMFRPPCASIKLPTGNSIIPFRTRGLRSTI